MLTRPEALLKVRISSFSAIHQTISILGRLFRYRGYVLFAPPGSSHCNPAFLYLRCQAASQVLTVPKHEAPTESGRGEATLRERTRFHRPGGDLRAGTPGRRK